MTERLTEFYLEGMSERQKDAYLWEFFMEDFSSYSDETLEDTYEIHFGLTDEN